ncbi:MAG: family 10 glycosylhydrolase, partial [bacterium]
MFHKFFLLLLLTSYTLLYSQPQSSKMQELRGAFLTTSNGLDWPKTHDKNEQQVSLRKIVSDMKAAHLNAIFFQIRARGDVYYHSRYEPWAENLTGTLGKDPGWDPLGFLLKEAHAAGMEVHGWFNVYKILGPTSPSPTRPRHVVLEHPEWVVRYENESWLDPGIPAVRSYLDRVLEDLVQQYDIDGICFDFIRYPGKDFPDSKTYSKYGKGIQRDNWRRENINTFVRDSYQQLTRIKPALKMGAAPLGTYSGALSAQPDTRVQAGALGDYFQDARLWLEKGWMDYLAPQVYWTLEFETAGPDFAHIARTWQK